MNEWTMKHRIQHIKIINVINMINIISANTTRIVFEDGTYLIRLRFMLEFSFIICKIQCSHNEMRARERMEDIKKVEERLISFCVLKVINIRFPQSQVSIVSPANRREVAYVISYFTMLEPGLVFSRPSSFLSGAPPFPTAKMQNLLGEQRRPD